MSIQDISVLYQPLPLHPYQLSHRHVYMVGRKATNQPTTDLSSGLVLAEPYNVAYWNTKVPVALGQIQDQWQMKTWEAHQSGNIIFLPLVYRLPPPHPKSWRTISRQWIHSDSLRAVTVKLSQTALEHYQRAALRALEAGFDGIEIVVGSDSLIDYWLRGDIYYFSEAADKNNFSNRFSLLSKVIRSVHQVWNLRQIGVRFSSIVNAPPFPQSTYGTQSEAIGQEYGSTLLQQVVYRLNDYGLSFIHLSESDPNTSEVAAAVRPYYDGVLIGQGDYTDNSAAQAVEQGYIDLVSYPASSSQRPSEGSFSKDLLKSV